MSTVFKTTPFQHQLEEFEDHGTDKIRGLFWEPGVGKSKPIIDESCNLFHQGEIQGLFVLAPNGVNTNWFLDELPTHMWDDVEHESFLWQTSKKGTLKYKAAFKDFISSTTPFKSLLMSYNAIMTKEGADAAKAFLKHRECMYVLDESQKIKTPGSKTTKRVQASRNLGKYWRILTGTLVDDGPFDVYSQLRWLDPTIWHPLGIRNAAAFRSMFGVFETWKLKGGGRDFQKIIGYRNLNLMHEVIDSIGSRLLKKDVLDLPEKLYRKAYFELAPAQAAIYKQLRKQYFVMHDDGAMTSAELAIQRVTRLQQICSGYLPADEDDELRPIEGPNPRITLLKNEVDAIPGKIIIFAKYNYDVDQIYKTLKDDYKVVQYDGRTSDEDRVEAKESFQNGDADIFLAKESAAGLGITLTASHTTIYYNNTHRLGPHLQSQDRNHRIGQVHPVLYIYLVAEGTVDEIIVSSLIRKKELASEVMGDPMEDWL